MDSEKLEKLVAEMRRLGVTRYKSGDLEIDLGKAPTGQPEAAPEKSAEERMKAIAAEKERRRRTLLAATNWVPKQRS